MRSGFAHALTSSPGGCALPCTAVRSGYSQEGSRQERRRDEAALPFPQILRSDHTVPGEEETNGAKIGSGILMAILPSGTTEKRDKLEGKLYIYCQIYR